MHCLKKKLEKKLIRSTLNEKENNDKLDLTNRALFFKIFGTLSTNPLCSIFKILHIIWMKLFTFFYYLNLLINFNYIK